MNTAKRPDIKTEDIISMLKRKMTAEEIAERLCVSSKTVRERAKKAGWKFLETKSPSSYIWHKPTPEQEALNNIMRIIEAA